MLSLISCITVLYIHVALLVKMPLHVVDNSLCVFVCYPIPCLSVDNVSVTTMVPSTPTTQPITSHPTTPTLLTPRFAPDPKGNVHMAYHSALDIRRLSPCPPLFPFGVSYSTLLIYYTHTRMHTHHTSDDESI